MVSILSSLVLLAVLSGAFGQYGYYGYYGYYGNYGYGIGYYGNQYSCGGYSYRAMCPDYTITPGFCISSLSCAQFGTQYTCVLPGYCCRSPTTTISSCPTGLFSGRCTIFGTCPNGQTCTEGLCCTTTTALTACPTGGVGAGTCLQTSTGLTCGTGFFCTALTSGNICCPAASASRLKGTQRKIVCTGESKGCPEGLTCNDFSRCINTTLLQENRKDSDDVCPFGLPPGPPGMCGYKSGEPKCETGYECQPNGFCCKPHRPRSAKSGQAGIEVAKP